MVDQFATGDPDESHLWLIELVCVACDTKMEADPTDTRRTSQNYRCIECGCTVAFSMKDIA